jgi:hypothetical protein
MPSGNSLTRISAEIWLLASPLDGAEKRRSKALSVMLGVGPGHPRLGHPFPRRFSVCGHRAARRARCRSQIPADSERTEFPNGINLEAHP